MRSALLSLLALTGIAGAAAAQPTTTTPPVNPPATTAATPAGPPATTPPATPAAPASSAPPATPAVPAAPAAPAAPVAEAPATPPAPPPAPDPLASEVVATLNSICLPVTQGGNLDQLARANGYRRNRDTYVYRQPTFQVTIQPLLSGQATCELVMEYPVDTFQPVIIAVHEWAQARGMVLRPPFRTTSDLRRDVRSWEQDADGMSLVSEKRPDGTPVARDRDRSRLIYQRRPTPPPAAAPAAPAAPAPPAPAS